jgi:hypothetical protein
MNLKVSEVLPPTDKLELSSNARYLAGIASNKITVLPALDSRYEQSTSKWIYQ